MYWDGQQWSSTTPADLQQAGITQDQLRAAMAENRSVWVTNALAVYALAVGIISVLCDFLCGVGTATSVLGLIIGYLAFNKSKTTGAGKGLALSALIINGCAFAFGIIIWLVLFGGMASLGGSS
ncbi:hypothetical protein AWC05_18850 [Mycobacterium florentinum]|uniref:DUF4190 domain-containing protein n=2 Tax=Mycobacterium florentinum TaxID=292462 RepID=A0A1X1UBH9_MYCFL|nr:hypothetical protein AWC05_18850 [Mycobacterium florentinum]